MKKQAVKRVQHNVLVVQYCSSNEWYDVMIIGVSVSDHMHTCHAYGNLNEKFCVTCIIQEMPGKYCTK